MNAMNTGVVDPMALVRGFADWARVALAADSARFTPEQRQWLADFQRKDTRYGFSALAQMLTIARKSNDPVVYLGPVEVQRGLLLEGKPMPSLDELDERETQAQAALDIWQARDRRANGRNPGVRQHLREAALEESAAARALSDWALTGIVQDDWKRRT